MMGIRKRSAARPNRRSALVFLIAHGYAPPETAVFKHTKEASLDVVRDVINIRIPMIAPKRAQTTLIADSTAKVGALSIPSIYTSEQLFHRGVQAYCLANIENCPRRNRQRGMSFLFPKLFQSLFNISPFIDNARFVISITLSHSFTSLSSCVARITEAPSLIH
jgi:hypothetical protein